MQLRMWTYDLAREQTPTLDHLRTFLDTTRAGGYTAIGLYLEHRFAYPSTPWSHGKQCLTTEMVKQLQDEYPDIQIIPFINLLGHFEGMLYTEQGKQFAEERFQGLQACPCNPAFVQLCKDLIQDTLDAFPSTIIHIGGDETAQLGKCLLCREKDKAELYGNHFGPLAELLKTQGRTPAVWGDMFLEHPEALDAMPKETIIFDWQYFGSPLETSRKFKDKGFQVVCCPSIQTYNAVWCHLPQSEQNVKDAVAAARTLDAHGVCVTTWEMALFGNYNTLLPAIRGAGRLIVEAQPPEMESEIGTANPEAVSIDHNGQYKGPEEWDSISMGHVIATSLLWLADHLESEGITIVPAPEGVECLRPSGVRFGFVPIEIWHSARSLLLIFADLDLLRKHQDLDGVISGTIEGKRVEMEIRSRPNSAELMVLRLKGIPSKSIAYADLDDAPAFLAEYAKESTDYLAWARLMGIELQKLGGHFAYSQTRSGIKCRTLLYSNPFLAWLHHAEDLTGERGAQALQLAGDATYMATNVDCRGVSQFLLKTMEFIRTADKAQKAYAENKPGEATAALAPARQIFGDLETIAKATHLNAGGSLADIERCKAAREHVERVMRRVKEFGDSHLGYLPSFEHISHPKFVPHDQAAWWLINRWANE